MTSGLLIGDVVARTGLSADALRYYEREGLLGSVSRDTTGRRHYDADSLHLLDVLLCLRRTGMPIKGAREFADLVRLGAATVPERVALLAAHRRAVGERIAEMQQDLAAIDVKIATYTDQQGSIP